MKELVRFENVHKKYNLGEEIVNALQGISVSIYEGEFAAIAGPSGSGKSTMLNMIGCIDTPSSGKIYIDGLDVSGRTTDELSDLRAKSIGFIFQTFNLLPVLSAYENVEYPLLIGNRGLSKKETKNRVNEYLAIVGLEKFGEHRPDQMSGGQRQRVAIARALATRPEIILADEPTANLDSKTGMGILELMQKLNKENGVTFIFSTHDSRIMKMANNLIMIEDGMIIDEVTSLV